MSLTTFLDTDVLEHLDTSPSIFNDRFWSAQALQVATPFEPLRR